MKNNKRKTDKKLITQPQSEVVKPFKEPLKKHLISIFILLALTIGVYSNSLFNSFVFDDDTTITNNLFIRDWSNFPNLFSKYYFSRSGEATYRPVVTLSYFVDYSLWGLKPFGYHLTNLLLHSANVVIVYLFAYSLLGDFWIAFLSALLFSLHPVQSEAVNGISFREDLLIVFFLLLAFLLFLKVSDPSSMNKIRWWTFYISSLLLYLLALFSKEMAITFPLLLIGYRIFLQEARGNDPSTGWVHQEARFAIGIIGYVVVTLFYLFLYFGIFSNPRPDTFSHPDIMIRLITLPKVIAQYLWLILIPWKLNADYDVKFSSSLIEVTTIFSILILTGLGIWAFWLAKRYKKESFGIWWFFISLLPVMNIVAINHLIAERYLYLPFIGVSLFFSMWLIYPAHKYICGVWSRGVGIIVVLILLFYGARTVYRNKDWRDDITLWSKTITLLPESAKAHNNLGVALYKKGLLDEAIKEYSEAIRINTEYSVAHYNLGIVLSEEGLLDEEINEYRESIRIDPEFAEAHYNLGIALSEKGLLDEEINEYRESIRIDPEFAEAHYNLGNTLSDKGLMDDAIKEYRESIRINPEHANAHYNLGNALYKKGLLDDAIESFENSIKYAPPLYAGEVEKAKELIREIKRQR